MNHVSSFFPDQRGTRLHFQYWEDSSKGYDRVAILLHGASGDSGSYARLVPAFVAARFKLIALDFEGFGHSPAAAGQVGLTAMADSVESLYRRVEAAERGREIVLVGDSMGAVAALLFLKRHPARRTRLALVAPLVFGAPAGGAGLSERMAEEVRRVGAELMADPAFLEGRQASFFVGEADEFVPHTDLARLVAELPLAEGGLSTFPEADHHALSGEAAEKMVATILSWLGSTGP